jgi:hypothetical protein
MNQDQAAYGCLAIVFGGVGIFFLLMIKPELLILVALVALLFWATKR